MKKIIYIFAVIFLSIIVILNLFYTASMNAVEHLTIRLNNVVYILGVILLAIFIFFITKILDKYLYKDEKKNKLRKIILITAIAIYIIFSIAWVILIKPNVVADQIHVCNFAQAIYRGNIEQMLTGNTYAGVPLSQYIEVYKQQIPLAFIYSTFFRVIHFDVIEVLRTLNVISNILIVVALYKIGKQLSQKYKINNVLLFTLILTFAPLLMLVTFIYGDAPSLALSLFSIYYMMRYAQTNKWKYAAIASILMMLACMMRMNSLIFVIATVIYLILNLLSKISTKTWRQRILGILVIICYLIISIAPSSLVQNHYLNKYNLDKNKGIPTANYLLIGMSESWRANGWYIEEIGEYSIQNPEKAKEEYPDRIKERLTYLSNNIDYTLKFYTEKMASMWAENTYSAINNNGLSEELNEPLNFYQKALMIIICLCSLIVLIQNRKRLSLDLIFLITIFIGGFAFHILWEAKSRYIIPYIVVLMPIASININYLHIKNERYMHIDVDYLHIK